MGKSNKKKSYDHFNVSIYCPVEGIKDIRDLDGFWEKFRIFTKNMKVGKVYLECHRGLVWAEEEQLRRLKAFFEAKGIETAGGITTNDEGLGEGFASLCYTSEKGKEIVSKATELCAKVFDEFIFDDFYFANCRCPECVKAKGKRTWSVFRLEQKRVISEELIMKRAKAVNPDVNVIIKFPNWYEAFRETGYDLLREPLIFDSIYTGTETRNPDYAQQHLPKYLSYFIMRYFENVAPGRNLGGWFDPYECTYNLSSYLEQAYLTLFAKSREATLFCLGSLMDDGDYQVFPPAVGQLFGEVDAYAGKLGNPVGVAAYLPCFGRGEDNVQNYLGMCGIPFEPLPEYPAGENVVFLAEGAAEDENIIGKMQASLLEGADIIVTSGFVRKMGSSFGEFMNVTYSARKALVEEYADSKDNGLSISGKYRGEDKILIPQLDYYTNDVWELAGAYGRGSNFPVVLRSRYGNGRVCIVTVPDNMGDLYSYPAEILNVIRKACCKNLPCRIHGKSQVMMFLYDNDTVILRSDLPYFETVELVLQGEKQRVTDLVSGKAFPVVDKRVRLSMSPGVNYSLQIQ